MPAALALISRILLSPLWLLWQFYGVIWWAFNEESRRENVNENVPRPSLSTVVPPASLTPEDSTPGPRTARVAQGAAFEIIDSRPQEPTQTKPIGALRAGFVVSLLLAGALVFGVHAASTHNLIKPSNQLLVWLWSSCMVFVASLWPVRHLARRQALHQPANWRGQVRCVAGAAKDMGQSTLATAAQAKNLTMTAGRRVQGAATTVTSGARRLWSWMPRRTA